MAGGDKGTSRAETASFRLRAISPLVIGRDPGVFESGKPYFECVGKQFCRCGGPDLGLRARLTNNLIISNIMQAFTEELFLNRKAGVDPDLVLDTLNNSAARNGCIAFKTLCFQQRFVHQPLFCVDDKDTGLALDAEKN